MSLLQLNPPPSPDGVDRRLFLLGMDVYDASHGMGPLALPVKYRDLRAERVSITDAEFDRLEKMAVNKLGGEPPVAA